MLTPKIILYKHKTYTDGTHPIILQVVKNGKPIRKVIARCKAGDWLISKNRVSPRHLEAPRINNLIDIAIRDYGLVKESTFYEFFQMEIDKIKNLGQASQHSTFSMVKKSMEKYDPNFDWENINPSSILKYTAFLSKSNNQNSIRLYMQSLRKILKVAKKARLISENPLEDMTFKKTKSIKTKLDVNEIKILMNADLKGRDSSSRDLFIASIFLRGTRVSDLLCLRPENLRENRLIFAENKTGKINNYLVNDYLRKIFNRNIGKSKHGYIFDYLDIPQNQLRDKFELKKSVTRANSIIRYHLRNICEELGIDKMISMHIARHSFSRLANRTIKDTTITMGLVGHSSLSVHEAYITDISDNFAMDGYAQQVLDNLSD